TRSQVRAAASTVHPACHMFPASIGEETMISAGDECCPILERDAVRRFDGPPVGQYLGNNVMSMAAVPDSSIDRVAAAQVHQTLGSTVGHEDRRFALKAVLAGMAASPVGVHGPLERHPGTTGYLVQDRTGPHLVERHPTKLWGV